MASQTLALGMGCFFKNCSRSSPTRYPHTYTIRFRDALEKQTKESGFQDQDDAKDHLIAIYSEKKTVAPTARS
ncbi:hypothetical protein ACFWY6_21290 [Streptomyces sp. NPDC059037]|uniref:hypothetical protein n=1 Tax=Streptomyces sp. NPDC059037 TaxID=3346710 RepID=UPI0036CEEFB3